MIFLFCGPPGAGKTLSLVHSLISDEQFQGREVYVHGIPDLKVPHKVLEDPKQWRDVPDGSVIVVDEAWRWFPTRNAGKDVPEHVQAFADHRHAGLDVILATQDPADLDVFVRRRVNRYYQLQRPGNLLYCKRRVYEGVPNDANKLRPVTTEKWKYPKEVFELYRSTVLDTHQKRLPKKLYFVVAVLALAAVGIPVALWAMWGNLTDDEETSKEVSPVLSETRSEWDRVMAGNRESLAANVEPIGALLEPRLYGEPWTAAIYEGRLEPVEKPVLNCVLGHSDPPRCICHTEQSTVARVEFERCASHAVNGFYQPWRESISSRGAAVEPDGSAPRAIEGDRSRSGSREAF